MISDITIMHDLRARYLHYKPANGSLKQATLSLKEHYLYFRSFNWQNAEG